jgi:soluble lytic murein transglycosylase
MRCICAAALIAALLLINAAAATAEIYKYTDARGVMHFTNMPTSPKYRPVFPGKKSSVSFGGSFNDRQYDHIIRMLCREHQMDFALIKAVIKAESAFNPRAVSRKGAQGLMQLMPATAGALGVADAFDPAQNLDGGSRHLGQLLTVYDGDLTRALAAYNAGEGAVQRHGGVPPYRETRAYVKKVLQRYRQGAKESGKGKKAP